jgi:hypothetical protein
MCNQCKENEWKQQITGIFLSPRPITLSTRCVYETQMPMRVTNSIDSHAYIKAFEK